MPLQSRSRRNQKRKSSSLEIEQTELTDDNMSKISTRQSIKIRKIEEENKARKNDNLIPTKGEAAKCDSEKPCKDLKELDGQANNKKMNAKASELNETCSKQYEGDDISTRSTSSFDLFARIYHHKHSTQAVSPMTYRTATQSSPQSINMAHLLEHVVLGRTIQRKLKQSLSSPVTSIVRELQLFRTASPFDRRCTAMEWHPSNPRLLAAGSKGGDVIVWNTESIHNDVFIPGTGPGGSIQALKFLPNDHKKLVTASIDGTVTVHDVTDKPRDVLLDTMNYMKHWYCSLDVSRRRSLLVTGDNLGKMTLLSKEGKQIFNLKVHKQKITNTKFSPREDWLLCSASVDRCVMLWDIRMLKDKHSALVTLKHDKGVNSAYFSLTNGCRLLTTDQHHEIRVYDTASWTLERIIDHPHRVFQHITPIQAQWHPLHDLIVVGRYPDPKLPGYTEGEKRTIDVFCADSGALVCQLQDPGATGIVSLNAFHPNGDSMASSMGVNILLWKRAEEVESKQAALIKDLKKFAADANGTPSGQSDRSSGSSSRSRSRQTKETKTKKAPSTDTEKLKMKLKKNS